MKISNKCYCVTGLTHADLFSVNAGFIVGKNETVIIDSGFNNEGAQTIYSYANAVALDNKISTLIILEEHYDHTFGSSYFQSRGVKVVSHSSVSLVQNEIDDYISECNDEIEFERRRNNKEANIYFSGVKEFIPDVKISCDTVLKVGSLNLQVLLAPGHTASNIMVYEPEDGIIYVADAIYSGFLPTLKFGDNELWHKWLNTLDKIEGLKPNVLVPGHGPVLYREDINKEIDRHRAILKERLHN